jgi:hypothetical protein
MCEKEKGQHNETTVVATAASYSALQMYPDVFQHELAFATINASL